MNVQDAWVPRVGFSDFADWCVDRYYADPGIARMSPWDMLHGAGSCLLLHGLAAHASLGVQSPTFVEIGVQRGASTSVLLHVAERMNGRVISIDPDPASFDGAAHDRLRAKGCNLDRWSWHCAYSQDVAPIPADFLLVDGDHGYPAVCSDMARHGVDVRDGGIILLDDYHMGFTGKVRWIHERFIECGIVTIGPMAMIVKRRAHDAAFTRIMGDGVSPWRWQLLAESTTA